VLILLRQISRPETLTDLIDTTQYRSTGSTDEQ
jgi:hypothetical protein